MSSLSRSGGIQVKCKNCGRPSPADQFVVDHQRKMMICASCAKTTSKPVPQKLSSMINRSAPSKPAMKAEPSQTIGMSMPKVVTPISKAPVAPPAPKKIVQRDVDDDYLDKMYEQKQMGMKKFPRIDKEKIKYQCSRCGYHFPYNTERITPSKCPYCAYPVSYP